jgi:uncharacterized protein (DUF488 family)
MKATELTIYTIGHSNRSIDQFIDLLKEFGIQTLADVRSIPGSAKFPHFNKEALQQSLSEINVDYVWLEQLGGRRRKRKGFDSPNTGWTSLGFRNYADYMPEEGFKEGVARLLDLAAGSTTAYMCAEAVYWRCHRRLISDYLFVHKVHVLHIMGKKQAREHELTPEAVITPEQDLIYPAIEGV